MENVQEYLKKWSEKLSLSEDVIKSEYDKLLEEEKSIHKDLTLDAQSQRAIQRLALTYKKQLRSPAVGFEGVVIGVSDCVDMAAGMRRKATDLYKADPQMAIEQGVTDEQGTPLDARQTWANGKPNNNYGKPLPEHNFMRNVYGIATKSKTKEAPRFFTMTINGSKATDENIAMFKPVRFMAIDKTKEDTTNIYNLNASLFTSFNVDEKMILPSYKELLGKYCKGMICELKDLQEYHNKTKIDYNRIVVIEGDVSSLNLEPTSTGNRVMVVEDINASIEDLDSKGLTCWLPQRIDIDFAEGSKVLVVARTGQGKKKDEQGNRTEEDGDITLNTFGVYALPEYKVLLPENLKPITSDNLDFE